MVVVFFFSPFGFLLSVPYERDGDRALLDGRYTEASKFYSLSLNEDLSRAERAVIVFKKYLSVCLSSFKKESSCAGHFSPEHLGKEEVSLLKDSFREEPDLWKKFVPILNNSTVCVAVFALSDLGLKLREFSFLNSAVKLSHYFGNADAEIHAREGMEQVMPSYENELALGKLYYRKKSYERALEVLKKALGKDFSGEAAMYLAFSYSKMNHLSLAKKYIGISLEKRKDDPVALTFAGSVCRKLGEFESALRFLKRAYRLTPSSERRVIREQLALLYYDLGVKNFNLGKDEKAKEYFRKCVVMAGKEHYLSRNCLRYLSEIEETKK